MEILIEFVVKGQTVVFLGGGGGGGIVISRRQEIFFDHRLSACKFFPSTAGLGRQFSKFPKSRITGVVSADNLFQMYLWGRQFISAIFLMQTIFLPNHDTHRGKNNGP